MPYFTVEMAVVAVPLDRPTDWPQPVEAGGLMAREEMVEMVPMEAALVDSQVKIVLTPLAAPGVLAPKEEVEVAGPESVRVPTVEIKMLGTTAAPVNRQRQTPVAAGAGVPEVRVAGRVVAEAPAVQAIWKSCGLPHSDAGLDLWRG